jgi:hypothetical protein
VTEGQRCEFSGQSRAVASCRLLVEQLRGDRRDRMVVPADFAVGFDPDPGALLGRCGRIAEPIKALAAVPSMLEFARSDRVTNRTQRGTSQLDVQRPHLHAIDRFRRGVVRHVREVAYGRRGIRQGCGGDGEAAPGEGLEAWGVYGVSSFRSSSFYLCRLPRTTGAGLDPGPTRRPFFWRTEPPPKYRVSLRPVRITDCL